MRQKTISTWLPIFNGFYNTIFEPDETFEIDGINSEREAMGLHPVEFNEIEFNYKRYEKNISIECCEFIQTKLKENNFDVTIEFDEVVSPKYYNFKNDSIDINVTIGESFIDKMRTFILENTEEFDSYITKNYSSRSGFISAYSNDYKDWLFKHLNNLQDDGHFLGSFLQFICECLEIDTTEMYYHCLDSGNCYLSATNFNELTSK